MQPEEKRCKGVLERKNPRDGERPMDAKEVGGIHVLFKHLGIKHETHKRKKVSEERILKPEAHKN
jgi:hypothetical protein